MPQPRQEWRKASRARFSSFQRPQFSFVGRVYSKPRVDGIIDVKSRHCYGIITVIDSRKGEEKAHACVMALYEKVIKVKADVAAFLINCFPFHLSIGITLRW